jgi:hypothetical protein
MAGCKTGHIWVDAGTTTKKDPNTGKWVTKQVQVCAHCPAMRDR